MPSVRAIRPQRSDARANAEKILGAARALLSERGPEGLTVSEVAHRAGVNRTTAYQHFRTRDDLVAAVMQDIGSEVLALLHEEHPFGEQIDAMLEYYLERPEIARLWMYWMLADAPAESSEAWDDYQSGLRELTESPGAQAGVDPEMLGHILVSAVYTWSIQVRARAENDAEARADTKRFARELKRLLLYGLLKPEHWPDLVESLGPTGGREA